VEDRHKIKEWIWFACDCNDVPELAQVILVEWNQRFIRRMGDGSYSPVRMRARIRLSVPLWPRASAQDRRETVIHETCHCVVGYNGGFFAAPHGPEWKQAMRNCGLEPLRTHSVDRKGLSRRQRRFTLLNCPNEGVEGKCRINARQLNRLQNGTELWCKVCGLHLNWSSSIEEDQTSDATLQE
jgi:SprT protein